MYQSFKFESPASLTLHRRPLIGLTSSKCKEEKVKSLHKRDSKKKIDNRNRMYEKMIKEEAILINEKIGCLFKRKSNNNR